VFVDDEGDDEGDEGDDELEELWLVWWLHDEALVVVVE
jgi:hypothetical protein